MPELLLPETARPHNLIVSEGTRGRVISSDVYDICRRVAEVDSTLFVVELEHDDPRPYRYLIVEQCRDGVDRLVMRLRHDELDARVIERLRYIMHVPLADRARAIERELAEWEASERERQSDELYERVGRPMWTELERCGFVQRGVSYPKRGVKYA